MIRAYRERGGGEMRLTEMSGPFVHGLVVGEEYSSSRA